MTARTFLSATYDGVSRLTESETGDGRWTVESKFDGERIRSLAAGGTDPTLVFAGSDGDGIFRSTDRGTTWSHVGLDGEVVAAVAVAPSDETRVYAGVRPPAVYRSDDGGDSWVECESFTSIRGRRLWRSPAEPPFTAYVQGLAVSPDDEDVVVAGMEFGAVVRSTDGGETWSNHRRKAIRDCHSLVWHPTAGDCVYEGGAGIRRHAAARSTDGGETWVKPNDGLDRGYGWAVAAHPEDPDVWYVSASTGPFAAHGDGDAEAAVFRKHGESQWKRLDALPGEQMPYALCTDPSSPDHLWVGMANGDLWHSRDRGTTFERLDGRLAGIERAMIMLPPA